MAIHKSHCLRAQERIEPFGTGDREAGRDDQTRRVEFLRVALKKTVQQVCQARFLVWAAASLYQRRTLRLRAYQLTVARFVLGTSEPRLAFPDSWSPFLLLHANRGNIAPTIDDGARSDDRSNLY